MANRYKAIITVAGVSSRFNVGIPESEKELKAIYTEGTWEDTLLARMINKCRAADNIIIVGGYRYSDLNRYIDEYFPPVVREKIDLVYNEHYEDLASGYSLYLGIEQAIRTGLSDKIIFAEGDLEVDDLSFERVINSTRSVITYNNHQIYSNKAVICYCNEEGHYKYVFNTEHGLVRIEEPFSFVMNSGQIWKFDDIEKLKYAAESFIRNTPKATNLKIIQDYFDAISKDDIELVSLERWTNCNTRDDYKNIFKNDEVIVSEEY